ncbi:hypothetical protein AB0J90_31450 [Micromonospora sp. NPDC049523]|uniref:hypothetical protein n=1 Tax=Micromonospora sp. NPDC049523 TaxID=3155921 RepID=UPI0034185D77
MNVGAVGDALTVLDNTFLRYSAMPGGSPIPAWSFRHPTLREGFAAFIASDLNLTEILCSGLEDNQLLTQLDCGSTEARGVLISIPSALYPEVAQRIFAMRPTYESAGRDWSEYHRAKTSWYAFFTQRCGRTFLQEYLTVDPALPSRLLEFVSHLGPFDEPSVLAHLHRNGLLAESIRIIAVKRVSELAVETPDAGWIKLPEWSILMTSEERNLLLASVRNELLPELVDVVWNWGSNRPSKEDPEGWYEPLVETLKEYADALGDDTAARRLIDDALDAIDRAKENDWSEYDEEPLPYRKKSWHSSQVQLRQGLGTRSIFDDVDGD